MEVVDLGPEDADELAALFGDHDWWTDRTPAEVHAALAGTDIALGIRDDGTLVAAARVLADGTFYGTVYDVIVAEDRRGEGVGRRLMEAVVDCDGLTELEVLDLRCREGLVPFYERVGFETHDPTVEVDGREEGFVKMNYVGE